MAEIGNGTDPQEPTPYGDETDAVARVEAELLARIGEQAPERRLTATRRAAEFLGDPHLTYPVIHITGTNGKTSTARMTESILRAHGLRTGLMTSPHLVSIRERIVIDGAPIAPERFVENWRDIAPALAMTDAELTGRGELPLTFFEALTVLAFACFADAPVDVAVVEVGMGGEWDSTNIVDGQVAVIAPIAIDHARQLGSTVAEIARTKAGIIKPAASVVSAEQVPEALAELERAVALSEATLAVAGTGFALIADTPGVGGQLVSVQGIAGRYEDLFLPLFGAHQAANAALAIAAVESFLGRGTQPLDPEVLAEGLATATSPGRLQPIATGPTVVVDAAHNPHGARALAAALPVAFPSDHVVAVVGILEDKDARGVVRALAPVVHTFVVTQPPGERALDADEFARIVVDEVGPDRVVVESDIAAALAEARTLAEDADADADAARADAADTDADAADTDADAAGADAAATTDASGAMVLVAGSIVLVGRVMDLVHAEGAQA